MSKAPHSSFVVPSEFLAHADVPAEEDFCFVIMPFSEEFDGIWHAIKRSLESDLGLRVLRADDIYEPKPIMTTILECIQRAGFVIADLTGRNPNVFYELGMAHSIKTNVLLLTQDLDDVPFDLRHLRCIEYNTTLDGAEDLRLALKRAIDSVRMPQNDSGQQISQGDHQESDAISIEVIFTETIEEGGAYIGEVEDQASAKAEQAAKQNLGRIKAALARLFPLGKLEAEGSRLSFPGGYALSTSKRKTGSGFDISYEVTTTLKLSPPRLDVIDIAANRLGAYGELAYELREEVAIEETFTENKTWQDYVEFLDDHRITYNVEDVIVELRTEGGTSRLSLRHGYRELKPTAHKDVSCSLLRTWLLGLQSDVPLDAKTITQ